MALLNGKKLYRTKNGDVIELFSVHTAARELGITCGTLNYWIGQGVVNRPKKKVGKRKYYLREEVTELEQTLLCWSERKQEATPKKTLARELGICGITLDWHIKVGSIPPPDLALGNLRYYSVAVAEQIKAWWKKRCQLEEKLWHLGNGMAEAGATVAEFAWLQSKTGRSLVMIPEPAAIHGASNRNRYWTLTQCRKMLREIRKQKG